MFLIDLLSKQYFSKLHIEINYFIDENLVVLSYFICKNRVTIPVNAHFYIREKLCC